MTQEQLDKFISEHKHLLTDCPEEGFSSFEEERLILKKMVREGDDDDFVINNDVLKQLEIEE